MSVYLRNAEIGRNVGYYMELGKLSGAMAHQQKLVEVGFDYKKYKVLPGSAWVNAACFVNLNVDMACRHSNSETALAFYQKYGHFPEKKQPLSWQTKAVSFQRNMSLTGFVKYPSEMHLRRAKCLRAKVDLFRFSIREPLMMVCDYFTAAIL